MFNLNSKWYIVVPMLCRTAQQKRGWPEISRIIEEIQLGFNKSIHFSMLSIVVYIFVIIHVVTCIYIDTDSYTEFCVTHKWFCY